jgi:hypothetical protein
VAAEGADGSDLLEGSPSPLFPSIGCRTRPRRRSHDAQMTTQRSAYALNSPRTSSVEHAPLFVEDMDDEVFSFPLAALPPLPKPDHLILRRQVMQGVGVVGWVRAWIAPALSLKAVFAYCCRSAERSASHWL